MNKYTTNETSIAENFSAACKISALGGQFECSWNSTAQMSANAHSVLVSSMLKAGGVFDRLVATCPLRLTSPNAPSNRDTLGSILIAMLNGSCRYRHLDALSGDAATAELFGLKKVMSCDSVRRNLKAVPEQEGLEWIWNENLRLVAPLLDQDYILDLDPSVKPLYGHQEGAKFGYNPHKPGRPSHCYHSLSIAKLRLVLGVVVQPGDRTAGIHSADMLKRYLEWISGRLKPWLVRGDVGFGNETLIGCCENAGVDYLFKVKRSSMVKSAFLRFLGDAAGWTDAGDGWQCADTRLMLNGWSRQRRILIMRRPVEMKPRRRKNSPMREFEMLIPGLELATCDDEIYAEGYEWHALVTSLGLDPQAVSKLYRERGDCENIFDEMKNQWGWSGFVTQDMKRTALAAGLNVFAANCWNVFCRIGGDGSHQEATTTRRTLQSCIARIANHGRRKSITIFTAGKERAAEFFAKTARVLEKISAASQLSPEERWQRIIYYAFRNYPLVHRLHPPLIGRQMMLSLE